MVNMTNEEYHTEKEHISKSGLDRIHKSPFHFKNRVEQPDAPHFLIGRATHHFILEPDTFGDHYCVGPNVNKNSKVWKEFVDGHTGKDILSAAEIEMLEGMEESVLNHPEAGNILAHLGHFEKSFFTELHGVKVKCRPDWYSREIWSPKLNRNTRIVVDLKTARSAEQRPFTNSIFYEDYRYHVQAAFYLDVLDAFGIKADSFIFIVVEKTPPYPVAVYNMSMDAIDIGRQEYMADLQTLKECRETDYWPGYNQDQTITVYPPHWLTKSATTF